MAGTRIALTITVISLFCISSTLCDEPNKLQRKLKATLNPGCFICDNRTEITLVHIAAESDTDTIHYVWDFTGKPTILVALTGKGARFQVDWAAFFASEPGSVNFTETPRYTFMAVINRIFQYDDADDRAMLDAAKCVLYPGPRDGFPSPAAHIQLHPDRHRVQQHNEPICESTFRIELLFVVSEQAAVSSHFEVTKRKTLDDEHTPGIFEIVDVLSPGAFTFSAGGYMEYRPVSYTHPTREVAFSTETRQSQPVTIDSPSVALNTTLAYALYGASLGQQLVQGMNVSFGVSEDGFYRKTNYTTMTFQVGYGMPPAEELSAFVLIVASIGIGIPLIVLTGGLLYLCLKKLRNRGRFQQERL
ncbi:AGAP004431-PA-like protein [Anopheles sinensis]|uniref:AGAP004431-PA-like protein n=1 Tax=Anopheles sinensis TaxID=74873 RepID=A0A084WPA1_ANOSI|nr:AGAP004431-PA-like protein [Anopheles sinensis]